MLDRICPHEKEIALTKKKIVRKREREREVNNVRKFNSFNG